MDSKVSQVEEVAIKVSQVKEMGSIVSHVKELGSIVSEVEKVRSKIFNCCITNVQSLDVLHNKHYYHSAPRQSSFIIIYCRV